MRSVAVFATAMFFYCVATAVAAQAENVKPYGVPRKAAAAQDFHMRIGAPQGRAGELLFNEGHKKNPRTLLETRNIKVKNRDQKTEDSCSTQRKRSLQDWNTAFEANVAMPIRLQSMMEKRLGDSTRRLQMPVQPAPGCFEQVDDPECTLEDYPFPGVDTDFYDCPTGVTNVVECQSCTIVDAALYTCNSCGMCSDTVEYDCSNLFAGDCVVYACDGTCSYGGVGGTPPPSTPTPPPSSAPTPPPSSTPTPPPSTATPPPSTPTPPPSTATPPPSTATPPPSTATPPPSTPTPPPSTPTPLPGTPGEGANIIFAPKSASCATGIPIQLNAFVTLGIDPLAGIYVTFEVTSGPNKGEVGVNVTDATGKASWTFTNNGVAGSCTYEACINYEGEERCDSSGQPPPPPPPVDPLTAACINCNSPDPSTPFPTETKITATTASSCGPLMVNLTGAACWRDIVGGLRKYECPTCMVKNDGPSIVIGNECKAGDHVEWSVNAANAVGQNATKMCYLSFTGARRLHQSNNLRGTS